MASYLLFQLFPESLEAEEKGGSEGNSVSNDERNWKSEGLNFSPNFTVCQGQTCILDEWDNVISEVSRHFSCLYSFLPTFVWLMLTYSSILGLDISSSRIL